MSSNNSRLRISLFAAVLVALIAAPLALATAADGQIGPVTVLVTIERQDFRPSSVEAMGGRVVYIADLAPVAVLRLPAAAVGRVRDLPGVTHVSRDGLVFALAEAAIDRGRPTPTQPPQEVPWGVERIGAPTAWNATTGWVDVDGDGDSEIEVAIIDTGVDADHVDLSDNIKWGIAVLNGRIRSNYDDKNGHGTHVTGTVAAIDNDVGVVGVAHDVEVYMIKALNNAGLGKWSDLVIAIDLAVKGPDGVIDSDGDGVIVGDPDDDAPEVISMSLGGSNPPDELNAVIISAYEWNITVVAAAGNEGADSPTYPAAYPEVIAVGATNGTDAVPGWSNRNPEVAAPGVNILSTYLRDSYETLSGTSMATPHVSGTAALIQAARLAAGLSPLPPGSETDDTADTVRGVLHVTADDLGDAGYDALYGYGIVRADLAVEAAVSS